MKKINLVTGHFAGRLGRSSTQRAAALVAGAALWLGALTPAQAISAVYAPPVITCPPDRQLPAGSPTGTNLTGVATATASCPGNVTISYSDAPVSATCECQSGLLRTWTAKDSCGVTASCEQLICVGATITKVLIDDQGNGTLIYNQGNAPVGLRGTTVALASANLPYTSPAIAGKCAVQSFPNALFYVLPSGFNITPGDVLIKSAPGSCGTPSNTCAVARFVSESDWVDPLHRHATAIIFFSKGSLPCNAGQFPVPGTPFETTQTACLAANGTLAQYRATGNNPAVPGATTPSQGTVVDYCFSTTGCGPQGVQITKQIEYQPCGLPAGTCPAGVYGASASAYLGAGGVLNFCYSITITNASAVTMTNIVVNDNTFAIPAGDFPVALPAGGARTVIYSAAVSATTTNLATVSANAVGDSSTVTNSATATAVVLPASIKCPANLTVQCTDPIVALINNQTYSPALTANLGGPGDQPAKFSQSTTSILGSCPNSSTNYIIWTATSDCAGSVFCTQTIVVVDTIKPVVTTCPTGGALGCKPAALPDCASVLTGVVATDNCGGTPTLNCAYKDSTNGCVYTRQFTITAADACGNTSTPCVVNYTWTVDNTGPVITCPPDRQLPANSSTNVSVTGVATATDTCSGPPTISFVDTVGSTACPGSLSIARIWTATDTCNNSASCIQQICVAAAPPSTTCQAITSAVQNVPITPVTLVGSGGKSGPYTFAAAGLPTGLSLLSDGTIAGTPAVAGIFGYVVTVTDAAGNKGQINCSVTVNPPPTTVCQAITNAVLNVPITPVTMAASGGCGAPYTFAAPGLPLNLSMSPSGTISGTPAATGTFPYQVTVTDKCGNSALINCSLTVNPLPATACPTISNAAQGVAIAPVTLTGSLGCGGPYTFTATGLPSGLTISSMGMISGTPAVNGVFPYTVTVKDKCGNPTTISCSVTVAVAPPISGEAKARITIDALGNGSLVYNSVNAPLGLKGTTVILPSAILPYTSPAVAGKCTAQTIPNALFYLLPIGFNVTEGDLVVKSQPNACGTPSNTCFVVRFLTPDDYVDPQNRHAPALVVFSATIPCNAGQFPPPGTPFKSTQTACTTGGSSATAYRATGNNPAVPGTTTPSQGTTVDYQFNLNCTPPTASCVVITSPGPANYTYLEITPVTMIGSSGCGGPYTFSATGLPRGLGISTGGTISGTPIDPGTFNYTVTVTDNCGNKGTVNCSMVVDD